MPSSSPLEAAHRNAALLALFLLLVALLACVPQMSAKRSSCLDKCNYHNDRCLVSASNADEVSRCDSYMRSCHDSCPD